MSQTSRSTRSHRDKPGGSRPSDRSSSRPPYYSREADPRAEHHQSKCSHICSRRGIMLICAVLTNSLILICLVAAQMVTSGMSSMAGMGGFDINTNFNLEGTELQSARNLDMQYSQMRAPGVYGGIPFTLTFGVVSLLFAVSGNKPPHLMPRKLLLGTLVFQAVASVVYVVAVGLYLHFIIGVNATDVCKQRERLYVRAGYTWMTCNVSGADAAVALFALITVVLYVAGTVLTIQTFRRVRRYLEDRECTEAEAPRARAHPQRAPLSC